MKIYTQPFFILLFPGFLPLYVVSELASFSLRYGSREVQQYTAYLLAFRVDANLMIGFPSFRKSLHWFENNFVDVQTMKAFEFIADDVQNLEGFTESPKYIYIYIPPL